MNRTKDLENANMEPRLNPPEDPPEEEPEKEEEEPDEEEVRKDADYIHQGYKEPKQ